MVYQRPPRKAPAAQRSVARLAARPASTATRCLPCTRASIRATRPRSRPCSLSHLLLTVEASWPSPRRRCTPMTARAGLPPRILEPMRGHAELLEPSGRRRTRQCKRRGPPRLRAGRLSPMHLKLLRVVQPSNRPQKRTISGRRTGTPARVLQSRRPVQWQAVSRRSGLERLFSPRRTRLRADGTMANLEHSPR